jgi:hypothetical protein
MGREGNTPGKVEGRKRTKGHEGIGERRWEDKKKRRTKIERT